MASAAPRTSRRRATRPRAASPYVATTPICCSPACSPAAAACAVAAMAVRRPIRRRPPCQLRFGLGQYPHRPADVPQPHHAPLCGWRRRHFDLFGKSWSWDSYFQHGETDTSIKIYNMPLSGAPAVRQANGSCRQRPVLALQPGAGRGVQLRRPDRLPQHRCPGLWLRAVQSLRWRHRSPPARSPISTARTVPAAPPSVRTRSRPSARKPSASRSMVRRSRTGPARSRSLWVTNIAKSITASVLTPMPGGITSSTPATVNEPCTDPFVDCGSRPHHRDRSVWALERG